MNNNRVIHNNINSYRNSQSSFNTNSIHQYRDNQIITGYFPKENTASDIALKKFNDTLSGLLLCVIVVTIISYFFVVSSEIKLNEYSRETTLLNVENAELQNKLDRLKSFNNVDLTMQKNNLLQRPEQVIEIAVKGTSDCISNKKKQNNIKPESWTIGY